MQSILKVLGFLVSIPVLIFFVLAIFLFPFVASVSTIVANRETVRNLISHSGIYDQAITVIIETSELNAQGTELQSLVSQFKDPTTNEGKLLREIVTPQSLETAVNKTIDGTYDWLEGKTEIPDFTISLLKDDQTFDNFLKVMLTQKIEALPACKSIPDISNPFELDCRPPGFVANDLDPFLVQFHEMPEYQQLMDRTTFNSRDVFTLTPQESQGVQLWFLITRLLPLIGVLVLVAVGLLLWCIFPYRQSMVILLGVLGIGVGSLWILGLFLTRQAIMQVLLLSIESTNMSLGLLEIFRKIAIEGYGEIFNFAVIFSVLLVGMGIGGIAGMMFYLRMKVVVRKGS